MLFTAPGVYLSADLYLSNLILRNCFVCFCVFRHLLKSHLTIIAGVDPHFRHKCKLSCLLDLRLDP